MRWPAVDQQRYAAEQCIDRYRDGPNITYRRCTQQTDVFPMRGLRVYLVEPERYELGGKPVLVVKGTVINDSDQQRRVPMLEGQLSDDGGRTLHRWSFAVPTEELPSGKSVSFRSVLNEVPSHATTVSVSFAPLSAAPSAQ